VSSKVCVPAWNEGPHVTTDAVTLAQLVDMVDALGQLGFDAFTPVTFLFDDDHVWLETVEFDDNVSNKLLDREQVNQLVGAYSNVRIPRVVESLGDAEKDAQWIDSDLERWAWRSGQWSFTNGAGTGPWFTSFTPTSHWGPYTEVVE
jgi:hypothetical protein